MLRKKMNKKKKQTKNYNQQHSHTLTTIATKQQPTNDG